MHLIATAGIDRRPDCQLLNVSYDTPIAVAISVGDRPSFFLAAINWCGVMQLAPKPLEVPQERSTYCDHEATVLIFGHSLDGE
jgi:hypothetical protein